MSRLPMSTGWEADLGSEYIIASTGGTIFGIALPQQRHSDRLATSRRYDCSSAKRSMRLPSRTSTGRQVGSGAVSRSDRHQNNLYVF